VQERFGLHELAVEDAQSFHLRPKIEHFDDVLFAVVRTARYVEDTEEVEFGEISLFLGAHFAVSVRQGVGSDLHPARLRLEQRPELLRTGPTSVLWAVLDQVVDDYAPVVEALEQDIEEVEQTVFAGAAAPTQRVYFLRREITDFYRAVHPLLGPLDGLERTADDALQPYFRDIGDHLRLVNEEVAAQRDVLTTVLEASIAMIALQQNEVVRRISGWGAILLAPTLVAAVYGMNFEHMPELGWGAGYPLAIGLMLAVGGGLFAYFKRSGWL
jgi:magnesium transporter